MSVSHSLERLKDNLALSHRMPVVFLGHGTPMNAIHDTQYSRSWSELGRTLPRPQAILVVSAHWATTGTTLVDVSAFPRTIHDFHGFPQTLFDQQYPASGNPDLARDVVALLASHNAQEDDTWGLDHGAWTVLSFLYLGSGNIVHNLSALRPGQQPPDWAVEFDTQFAQNLSDRNFAALTDTKGMGTLLKTAHPNVDHYIPALTIAGASDNRDRLTFMNDSFDMSSISMRSYIFQSDP